MGNLARKAYSSFNHGVQNVCGRMGQVAAPVAKAGVVVGGMAGSMYANAAIVAGDLTAIGTSITTDADTVFTWVLPIIGTVMGLTIGLKLLKKFTGKI